MLPSGLHPTVRAIESRHNPIVRAFRELARNPDETGARVLLDGVHLLTDARAAGVSFDTVAIASTRLDDDTEEGRLARELERRGVDVVSAAGPVFAALSPVRTPSGIVALARRQPSPIEDVCRGTDAFLVVAVDVQDPGNVGALLRAAEAGGATGAIVCGASANPFSWKALRGSMGSALRLPTVAGLPAAEAVERLRRSGFRMIASVARGGSDPDALDWRGRIALLIGGEGPGLGDDVVALCETRVTIPMAPGVESLNVAAAGAVLIYAARRQRL
jgi:TrmH family RNA methyltransferase